MELKLYQPLVIATSSAVAAHPWLYGLDENCLPQRQDDGTGTGTLAAAAVNIPPASFLSNKFIPRTGSNTVIIDGNFQEQNFISRSVEPNTGRIRNNGSTYHTNRGYFEASVILDPVDADPTFTTADTDGSNTQAGMPR